MEAGCFVGRHWTHLSLQPLVLLTDVQNSTDIAALGSASQNCSSPLLRHWEVGVGQEGESACVEDGLRVSLDVFVGVVLEEGEVGVAAVGQDQDSPVPLEQLVIGCPFPEEESHEELNVISGWRTIK